MKHVRITTGDHTEDVLVLQVVQDAIGAPLLGYGNVIPLPAMFRSVDEFRVYVEGIANRMGVQGVEVKRVS